MSLMAALYGTSAALGAGQALSSAFKTKEEKENLKRIQELTAATPGGYDAQAAELASRTARKAASTMASEAGSNLERKEATSGTADAASFERARVQQQREAGIGRERAAIGGLAAGMQAGKGNQEKHERELSLRTQAAGAARSGRAQKASKSLSDIMAMLGAAAGEPPETWKASDAFGKGLRDKRALRREEALAGLGDDRPPIISPILDPLAAASAPGAAPSAPTPAPSGTDSPFASDPFFEGVRPRSPDDFRSANTPEGWMRRALVQQGMDPGRVKVLTDKELLELYAEATR